MNVASESLSLMNDLWDVSSPDIQVFSRNATREDSWIDAYEESTSPDEYISESAVFASYLEQVVSARASTFWGRVVFVVWSSICVLVILGVALVHIWAQGQATRLGFVYSQESKKTSRLKEERRLLKLQLAKLRDPQRLARIARQQLGMRLPNRAQVISEDKVIEQLQRPVKLSQRRISRRHLRLASFDNKLRIQ